MCNVYTARMGNHGNYMWNSLWVIVEDLLCVCGAHSTPKITSIWIDFLNRCDKESEIDADGGGILFSMFISISMYLLL